MSEGKAKISVTLARDEDLDEWARSAMQAIAATELMFVRDDGRYVLIMENGPRVLEDFNDFAGLIYWAVSFKKKREGSSGPYEVTGSPSYDQMRVLFKSQGANQLRKLRAVVHSPVIAWKDGQYRPIFDPGFDAPTGIYYWRRAIDPIIEPTSGTKHLQACLSGVPFEAECYKANVLAWLLGAIIIDPLLSSPLLAVTGNVQGVGKTSLVQACGYVITGKDPQPIATRGGEFEKQLSMRFLEHDRFVLLDNVISNKAGRHYQNDRLARLLTGGWSKSVRILGHSRAISNTGVMFALTANDCSLDADLTTRSIPVSLYRETPDVMDPYVIDYVRNHRAEIYGELLHLAMNPSVECPLPEDRFRTFRFQHWLRFVWPRIVPHFGELGLDEIIQVDEIAQELFSYGADKLEEKDRLFTAADLTNTILNDQEAYPALAREIRARGRSGQTKCGYILKKFVGKTFREPGVGVLRLGHGSRYRHYHFELVEKSKETTE